MNAQFQKFVPCILCQQPAAFLPGSEPLLVECERCGRFKITLELSQDVLSKNRSTLPSLCAATRHSETSSFPRRVSPEEYSALVNHLYASGLLSRGTAKPAQADRWCLTMKRWDALEPLQSGGIAGRCFVAMSFDAELDSAYSDAIKPAISEAGYDPICLKDRLPNENICDVILAKIRKAQFIVADFTKQRGGVYFEAGFAKALGKDVFWTCHADDFGDLHFDTNHYGHVKWSEPADLKKQLRDWIIAELGFGPHRASEAIA